MCAVVALAGSTVSAQSLKYSIDGGTAADLTSSTTIALGTVNSARTIHIYDSGTAGSGVPTLSVPFTVNVSGTHQAGGAVTVYIQGADVPLTLPSVTGLVLPLDRGIVNLGTTGQPVLSFSSDALRDATTLVAWIGNETQGSVTGNISVGRIYVIDAPNDITGTLTATANDPAANPGFGSTNFAIQRIRVGNLLGADVIAQGASGIDGVSATSSIGTIAVGPTATSAIAHDIKAEKGAIGSRGTTLDGSAARVVSGNC